MLSISVLKLTRSSLRRKLFGYMTLLALILAAALCAGLFLIGRINNPEEDTTKTLELQMNVFQTDMENLWRNVSVLGTHLSEDLSSIIDDSLHEQGLSFYDLKGNAATTEKLEESMIEPMCGYIRQTDCSGAFIILDTTLDTTPGSCSRSGIYIQKSNAQHIISDDLLFRGMADAGKRHNVMPHRKWAQEFNTTNIPEFKEFMTQASQPVYASCRTTDILKLPGTSEKTILMTVPVYGSNGILYGLCGFSVNQSYFNSHHEQPSNLKSMACLLTSGSRDPDTPIDADASLVSSAANGYCYVPPVPLSVRNADRRLSVFSDEDLSFTGIVSDIKLASGDSLPHRIVVMIPESDLKQNVMRSALQTAILSVLLMFFAAVCCIYFTQRCMKPLLNDLEHLKQEEIDGDLLTFEELYPVSDWIIQKDRAHRETITTLDHEKKTAQERAEQLKDRSEQLFNELRSARTDADRLAYSRKTEIDPDAYKVFTAGIETLTATERAIFTAFADGMSIPEIARQTGRAESTLRTHIRNIYSKLDVHSAKQLRLYAAVMRRDHKE